jgi:hypothetical protein
VAGWQEREPLVGVRLDLELWRRAATNDRHSVVCGMHEVAVSSADPPELALTLDAAPWTLAPVPAHLLEPHGPLPSARSLAGVTTDFMGNPLPALNPLPGPFQAMKPGRNVFAVWPVAPADNPPPAELLDVPEGMIRM